MTDRQVYIAFLTELIADRKNAALHATVLADWLEERGMMLRSKLFRLYSRYSQCRRTSPWSWSWECRCNGQYKFTVTAANNGGPGFISVECILNPFDSPTLHGVTMTLPFVADLDHTWNVSHRYYPSETTPSLYLPWMEDEFITFLDALAACKRRYDPAPVKFELFKPRVRPMSKARST